MFKVEIIHIYSLSKGFINGNICASLIGLSSRNENNLSEIPNQAVGGIPCIRASINSQSAICASSSQASLKACCCSNLSF
ncbi:MAG: hypothetical protein ACOZBL_03180 [Patescibacteria group bacterium]